MAYEVCVWQLQLMPLTIVAAASIGPTDGNHDTDDGIVPIDIVPVDTVESRCNNYRPSISPSSREYPAAPSCMAAEQLLPVHRFQPETTRQIRINGKSSTFM